MKKITIHETNLRLRITCNKFYTTLSDEDKKYIDSKIQNKTFVDGRRFKKEYIYENGVTFTMYTGDLEHERYQTMLVQVDQFTDEIVEGKKYLLTERMNFFTLLQ
jgi:hypothetical protein